MGQRVMIAIALINNPQVLIADEPTSALDARLRNQILELLVQQSEERQMAMLLISHDLPLVAEHCDRVLVMYQGEKVDEMAASRLPQATHPYTRTLWTCRPNAKRSARCCRRWTARSRGRRPIMALVEVNDLQVRFGEKTAVSAASFAIEKGETFSLIGESGCGKSTILRVLAGLQREWNGRISILGDALRPGRRFEGELRRNVQMVFQDPWASLHPNHTVARTLSEPLNIHGETQIAEKWRMRCSRWGFPPTRAGVIRTSFPAASVSAWPLPARCCCARSFCCWTSRPRRWICRCRRKS
jgi:ABC-type glutathione transport system ATPase component